MKNLQGFDLQRIDWAKGDGLVPVVAQDAVSGQILMIGWANNEALTLTLKTGFLTFYSRSRQMIWQKGETSGNVLLVKSVHLDCDGDSVLALVTPIGNTCHTGSKTCFKDSPEPDLAFLVRLGEVIRDRKINRENNSYTSSLFDQGLDRIVQKVGEEATETIIAAKNTDDGALIGEVADLVFHLMVMLEAKSLNLRDIAAKLKDRNAGKL